MSESFQNTKLRIETFITENFPAVDISPGSVLSELLVKLSTTLQNPIKNDIEELAQTNTVLKTLESVSDTYSPIIDGLATNYSVLRNQGSKAVGKLKVTVNDSSTLFIDQGFKFIQPVLNLEFETTGSYRITTNPKEVRDIKLIQKSKGSSLYYFIIPVVATGIGEEYQLSDQTSLNTKVADSITDFVDAKAYGNFSTGKSMETDRQLISRFQGGLSHKTLLTRKSMLPKLTELYPNLRDISIVSASDAEMTRSKQNLLGISTLGTADVYVRTSLGLETMKFTKSAIKTDEGKWLMNLDYSDVAGFYRIISILPVDQNLTGSLIFTPDFSYSNTGFKTTNLVNNKYEARFSKYQTASVIFDFEETTYDLPVKGIGDSAEFDVLVTGQPNIIDLQNVFLDNDERVVCADYLVKAMLPCFVTVGLKLERTDSYSDFPVDKLKQDIFKYINNLKFGEDLYASKIIDLCHNYQVKKVKLPIKLSGDIYTDHSTVINITSKDVLSIPEKLSSGVSKKTTGFIANYFNTGQDPDINITDAISIEVQ